jgi:cell wall-associated NlpC family hydrolase
MLNDKQREAVVKEALTWIDTPYRGHVAVKGVGADCGQLLYGVYRACGLLPELDLPKDYSLQVSMHRASTEYMDVINTYFEDIPEEQVQPGDLVCYRLGLAMAHAAIVISWPAFILQAELRHGVGGSHGINNPHLQQRHYLKGSVRVFRTLRTAFCKGDL